MVFSMYARVLIGVSCAILAMTSSIHTSAAQEDAIRYNMAQGANFSVRVKSVIARSVHGNKVVYEITYKYSFRGRDSVYIKGLGIVPSQRDEVNYLTFDQQLEFWESAGGPMIVAVPLQETTNTQSGESLDLPQETEFPQAFRSETWARPSVFHESATSVIQKYFIHGYVARQNNRINYYITEYRSLPVSHRNLRSQIAVMVSHPYDAMAKRFTYRIQFIARDRPRMSNEWRYSGDRSEDTMIAAAGFIDRFVEEIRNAGRDKQ